jgi:crotonobetaine/carnitine-CoA ligase
VTTVRVANPRERTLPALLERRAERFGERPLLRAGGTSLSFRGVRDAAAARAGALTAAGIGQGDRVAAMSENRYEPLELWLGCAWLGAVFVPINTALRGLQLEHVLANSGARAIAVEAALREVLDAVDVPAALEQLWTIPDTYPAAGEPIPPRPARPDDAAAILYTSGTTGPSKGVVCPHAQWYWWGVLTGEMLGIGPDDTLYTCLPLFHTNALNTFCQALLAGAVYHVGPRFSASRFWRQLAEAEATVTYLLGPMVSILLKQPAAPGDRGHRVRVALAPATPPELHEPFRERFGVLLVDAWGSTETNIVISNTSAEPRPGTLGRVLEEFEARVVDEEDVEVPDGTAGELVVRSREPFAFSLGYFGSPEATAAAWRNGWFHTGDRVVRDADGVFRFVDRLKDVVRRRGENISSFEVEQVLQAHPDVAAAAVVPVPSELGEDEVLACVVPRPGASVDPAALVRFCEGRIAGFAIPRYVEVVDALPLTASGKVEKYRLRQQGVRASTWDRER